MIDFFFRLARFRNEMLRNLPAQQQQDQLAAEANGEGQGEAAADPAEAGDNNTTAARTTKLVLLKENTDALEIKQYVNKTKACSILESALFISETKKDMFDHDYAQRPISSKEKNKKNSKKDPR